MCIRDRCYIHSLKQGEKNVLGEATILKRLGDNEMCIRDRPRAFRT